MTFSGNGTGGKSPSRALPGPWPSNSLPNAHKKRRGCLRVNKCSNLPSLRLRTVLLVSGVGWRSMVRRILWLLCGLFAFWPLVFSALWTLLVSLCSKYMAGSEPPVRSHLWTGVFLSARESWGWDLPCQLVFPGEGMRTSQRHRFRITQLFVYFSGIFIQLHSNENWKQRYPTRSMSPIW